MPGWRWGSSISSALLLLHCAVLLCSSADSRAGRKRGDARQEAGVPPQVSPQGPSTQLKLQTCTAALLKSSQHCLLRRSLGREHQKPKSREVQGRQDHVVIWGEAGFSSNTPRRPISKETLQGTTQEHQPSEDPGSSYLSPAGPPETARLTAKQAPETIPTRRIADQWDQA